MCLYLINIIYCIDPQSKTTIMWHELHTQEPNENLSASLDLSRTLRSTTVIDGDITFYCVDGHYDDDKSSVGFGSAAAASSAHLLGGPSSFNMLRLSNFSKRQWLTLIVFSIADFCNAICVSLQAPFYPQEVRTAFDVKQIRNYVRRACAELVVRGGGGGSIGHYGIISIVFISALFHL